MKKSLTAGSAILTAGVVALNPVAGPVPDRLPVVQTAQLDLTAVTDPLQAATILAGGVSSSLDLLAHYTVDAAAAVLVGAYELGQQDNRGLYNTVRQFVYAPAVIGSPTFEALAEILPPPVGGTDGEPWTNTPADGALVDFIDQVLRPAAQAINAQIAQALHVYPETGTPLPDPSQVGPPANPFQGAVTLAVGAGGTAVRLAQVAALSPLAVARLAVEAVGALATGNNKTLYLAVRDAVDAPLWAADPTIDALAKVLPGPFGGTDGKHEVSSAQDGQIIKFRDKVLWGATNAVRNAVAKALNVDPQYGNPLPSLHAAKVDTDPVAAPNAATATDTEVNAESTEKAVAAPDASPIRTTKTPARTVAVDKVDEDAETPGGATKTGTEIATKSDSATVTTKGKTSADRVHTAIKKLNDRLRGKTKKPAMQEKSAQNETGQKASADSAG